MIDFSKEILFQTTRSGGKGGQNVNKVETAVIGSLDIAKSNLLSPEQKELVFQKLANKINSERQLIARSQAHRTQLANKEDVVEKINHFIFEALRKKKARIATRIGKAAKERRIESKKKLGEIKSARRRFKPGDF